MATVITQVRELIGDVAESDESHFSDDQVEAALDRRRSEVIELALTGIRSRAADGTEEYLRWIADRAPWEEDAVLLDTSFAPIDSDDYTADETDGIWVFAESIDGVYVSGMTFDIYATAADLLDQWALSGAAAQVSAGGAITEWETDGQKVKRSATTTEERRSLASHYRAMSLPLTGSLVRSDLRGEAWL